MQAHNLHDLRELARRRLPKGIFEYIDRGVEDEVALRENRDAFDRVKLSPYVLRDVAGRSSEASLFGAPLAMPVAVAPTGSAGLVWYQGELELARAAAAAGIPFTLATAAMTSMEAIASEVRGGRLWFQLNMFADRSISHAMVARAERLGFEALLLTADCSVTPNREYNARNGFALPFRASPRSLVDMSLHPRWLAGVMLRYLLGTGLPKYENYPAEMRTNVTGFSTLKGAGRCEDLNWNDVATLRRLWPRTLIVKGILRPEDARHAVELGVDGVVVSNHGGRTVDSTQAPIAALPRIVDAIGHQATVLMDGGIRRGSDVIKALALGAEAVLVGRPTLFGTAIGGQRGASHALLLLRAEIEREMGLMGLRQVDDITRDLLAD
ncbi:Alpha-hydroxy-acid oxidizing enzyme [Burkholderiales bacterium 8X]|nr:Alpha-hydroxy-acid oxidizing enzyme [Burkholderiales bacterium 8X]